MLADYAKQYPVHLYNSLSREREAFNPSVEGKVGMYVCGPTVYGEPHLGHARSAITFDIVARYFRFLGYKVRYVRNITDVGHMENEMTEEGEDKILKKARLEQIEPMEVVQTYTVLYHRYMDLLNVERPSIEPTASGHITEQIKIVQQILANGYAYEVNGSVYFDLDKYSKAHPYGQLSGKVLEDLQVASRDTEGLDEKRSPHDFALWKKAKPEHIMRWESPWSEGFPGWHLECTTMSAKYLGTPFDIHGGGMDLQFPHHEAEIAQCTGAFGKHPVRYWMHNNLLTIEGQKMAKSLNNFITLAQMFSGEHDKLEQAYSPMVMRFFVLQAHYRSPVDFSNQALQAAEKGYQRLMNGLATLESLEAPQQTERGRDLDQSIRASIAECYANMSDDFNTAKTIASLFDLASKINALKHGQLKLEDISATTFEEMKSTYSTFIRDVLGLEAEASNQSGKTEEQRNSLVELLIEIRQNARKNKDFATSDQIRDQLTALGIQLKDEKGGGTSFTINH